MEVDVPERGARGPAGRRRRSSAPPLLAALVVGLAVAVVQALTQVQEQTRRGPGPHRAVFAALFVSGYWMAAQVSALRPEDA